jgi:predicted nucleic acid-binding protein
MGRRHTRPAWRPPPTRRALMAGLILDAGALIGLERNDRRVIALLARLSERGDQVTIPAGALAQAIRHPERQVRLARLVRQPSTTVVPLDRADATSVGRLLAGSGTSDVVDAHVVVCARRAGHAVVTSDADDLLGLDPRLRVLAL